VKQYRDKYNGGVIKFGKAFLIGLYITLVAGLIYVIAWEIFFNTYAPDFGDQYIAYLEEQMVESGLNPTAIQEQLGQQRKTMDNYQNNIMMRMGFTLLEIVPVGLLISVISGLLFGVILRKK